MWYAARQATATALDVDLSALLAAHQAILLSRQARGTLGSSGEVR